jgi:hypothetical protein
LNGCLDRNDVRLPPVANASTCCYMCIADAQQDSAVFVRARAQVAGRQDAGRLVHVSDGAAAHSFIFCFAGARVLRMPQRCCRRGPFFQKLKRSFANIVGQS